MGSRRFHDFMRSLKTTLPALPPPLPPPTSTLPSLSLSHTSVSHTPTSLSHTPPSLPLLPSQESRASIREPEQQNAAHGPQTRARKEPSSKSRPSTAVACLAPKQAKVLAVTLISSSPISPILSVARSLSHSLPLFHTASSPGPLLCACMCVCVCVCVCVFVCTCLSVSCVSPSQSPSFSSLCLCATLSLCFFVSVSFCPSVSVSPSVYIFLCAQACMWE